ncbi:MAG TPA: MerR family transcriptional regulator [Usitatibacter sp.]|jgi:MerR family mercuric resistance operon transcriptional regulator|nr:MerR family transcriptional regulator [Usitatibacter sp.]
MQQGMTIGRLAKAAGVHVETIRYYQRIGLIPEPQKPQGGHRRYAPAVMERITFIRRAQQLGFSLEEVKKLLSFSDGRSRKEVRQIAETKYELLGARVEQLNDMRAKLRHLIDLAKQSRGAGPCPIITALKEPE